MLSSVKPLRSNSRPFLILVILKSAIFVVQYKFTVSDMHRNSYYYILNLSYQKLQYKEYGIELANTWKNTARLTELPVNTGT